jgi:hypothetical protein
VATSDTIPQPIDLAAIYRQVLAENLNAAGNLPTWLARLSPGTLDGMTRQRLADNGAELYTEDSYRRALRAVIAELASNPGQVRPGRIRADLAGRAEAVLTVKGVTEATAEQYGEALLDARDHLERERRRDLLTSLSAKLERTIWEPDPDGRRDPDGSLIVRAVR